ncbi:YdcH family protein [Hoeflea sp.]|uniref:YdcH family protein n=1 Tax=Hoeflea sp. TaxID=1940281 RepID=UPI003B01D0DB
MAIQARLETLEKKHGALEEELHSALSHPSSDDTKISEIKRRKLRVKDEIERLRGEMSNARNMELN